MAWNTVVIGISIKHKCLKCLCVFVQYIVWKIWHPRRNLSYEPAFLGIVTPLRMTEWQKYVRHVHLDNSYSFM